MLKALADGETNPAALAALAHQRLRATPEQLCDALGACTELKPVYRQLLKMTLEQLQFLEQQIGQLDKEMASLLSRTRMRSSGWRRCPVSEWTQRSRSLPKLALPQQRSPPTNASLRGSVPAPATKRAPA